MRKSNTVLIAVALIAAWSTNSVAANAYDVIYDLVNYPADQADELNPGTDSISGTIITNGALGPQADASNIIGGTLVATTPVGTFTGPFLGAVAYVSGSPGLDFTAGQILLGEGAALEIGFSSSPSPLLLIYENTFPTSFYGGYFPVTTPLAMWEALPPAGGPGSIAANDPYVIATVTATNPVPEPTSLTTLFAICVSVVGFASWRRRRSA